jgi:hypothetical protein
MNRNFSIVLVLTVCACGGNVVVDAATRPSGTGGLGTGGVVGSSTTVIPVSTGPGPSTSGVVTVGSSSSGPVGVTVATVTASSVTVTTSTVASSTGGFGACTNPQDLSVLAQHSPTGLNQDLYTCTVNDLGSQGGTAMCLVSKDGFSLGCAYCFAEEGQCGVQHCQSQCINGVPNPPCLACLAVYCNNQFTACSGIVFPG